jgi:hypothetical protein
MGCFDDELVSHKRNVSQELTAVFLIENSAYVIGLVFIENKSLLMQNESLYK